MSFHKLESIVGLDVEIVVHLIEGSAVRHTHPRSPLSLFALEGTTVTFLESPHQKLETFPRSYEQTRDVW